MATRKATENVSEESTTAPETEPTASIPMSPQPTMDQRMVEIETLVNHLLNSREHIAHCGSDHFVNDWR